MEKHASDIVALATDDSVVPIPAEKAAPATKKEGAPEKKLSSVPTAFTPTRKTRYSTYVPSGASKSTSTSSKPSLPSSKVVKSQLTGSSSKDAKVAYMGHTVQNKQKV